MFHYFDELASTIDEARDPRYAPGDVIVAGHQTAGRGQRGHTWSSPPGENLLFSVVIDSSFLRADQQFMLLGAVALALVDTFALYGMDARIKWTNDIYIGDRKITGVLIDHSLCSDGRMSRSGAGIGINVNQRLFDPALPNPTSMALETGMEFDRHEVLGRFHKCLTARLDMLHSGAHEELMRDYHSRIYRLGVASRFALPDGTLFEATIRGVAPTGELMLDDGAEVKPWLFREVSFVIDGNFKQAII